MISSERYYRIPCFPLSRSPKNSLQYAISFYTSDTFFVDGRAQLMLLGISSVLCIELRLRQIIYRSKWIRLLLTSMVKIASLYHHHVVFSHICRRSVYICTQCLWRRMHQSPGSHTPSLHLGYINFTVHHDRFSCQSDIIYTT